MVMQIIEEVASENGLAALLQEKPFAGINGSGKHNNWSLGTTGGVNLLNPKQINAASKNPEIFPVIMAALVSAIDKHGDLMRLSIASPEMTSASAPWRRPRGDVHLPRRGHDKVPHGLHANGQD